MEVTTLIINEFMANKVLPIHHICHEVVHMHWDGMIVLHKSSGCLVVALLLVNINLIVED